MRLIDADEVEKLIGYIRTKYACTYNQFFWDTIRYIEKKVRSLPTIEAVPVVHGKWVKNDIGIYFCSVCDSEAYWDTDYGQQLFDCCPFCGADMRTKGN